MAKATLLPWREKQPGERWFGEGPVGLIPFKPKATKSSSEPSSTSEEDPMAPATEALERWIAEQDRERMKQAKATASKDESTP